MCRLEVVIRNALHGDRHWCSDCRFPVGFLFDLEPFSVLKHKLTGDRTDSPDFACGVDEALRSIIPGTATVLFLQSTIGKLFRLFHFKLTGISFSAVDYSIILIVILLHMHMDKASTNATVNVSRFYSYLFLFNTDEKI